MTTWDCCSEFCSNHTRLTSRSIYRKTTLTSVYAGSVVTVTPCCSRCGTKHITRRRNDSGVDLLVPCINTAFARDTRCRWPSVTDSRDHTASMKPRNTSCVCTTTATATATAATATTTRYNKERRERRKSCFTAEGGKSNSRRCCLHCWCNDFIAIMSDHVHRRKNRTTYDRPIS